MTTKKLTHYPAGHAYAVRHGHGETGCWLVTITKDGVARKVNVFPKRETAVVVGNLWDGEWENEEEITQ